MPLKDRDMITFYSEDVGEVRVMKDDPAPKITGGYGGWTATQRPKKTSITTWAGVDPVTMDIAIIFEGWGDNSGQEIRIGRLSRMALPQGDDEPPVIELHGVGIPWHGRNRWVITSIDWGDNVIWDIEKTSGSMVRLRQDAVVHVMLYVDDDRVAFSRLEGAKPGGGAWPKHHIWDKQHDTLQKVASRFYHDPRKWRLIANANNIRDPKNIHNRRVLIIPRPGKNRKGK